MHADAAAGTDMKGAMRTGRGAASAFGQRRRPAGDTHGAQQVGVEDQFTRTGGIGHCPQRPDGEPVQRRDGARSSPASRSAASRTAQAQV